MPTEGRYNADAWMRKSVYAQGLAILSFNEPEFSIVFFRN